MTAATVCPGGVCDGSGWVLGPPQCTPGCRLRHAADCPKRRTIKCGACAKAELGEDLNP